MVVLLIVCVGIIYVSLDNESSGNENNSKVDDMSQINGTDVENNTNISSVGRNNSKNTSKNTSKNIPKNIPKNSKLSYSQALSIAKSFEGGVDGGSSTYEKYAGYMYDNGKLYWKFNIYDKKNNNWLGRIRVEDATGHIDLD